MSWIIRGVAVLLTGATLAAGAATATHLGAPRAEYPQGISLRDGSVHGYPIFFFNYHRSHRGGGLAGGK